MRSARLLRVLQQGEYTTVGGRTPIKTNVRIVAATNKDLRFAIQQGAFREDLFFRLNVVPIRLPPLRERPEDVPDLVRAFFQRGSAEGLPVKTFEPAAMERLRRYPWPGNVRELENLTRRLAALYPQDVIGEALIEAELSAGASPLFPPPAADDGRKRVGATAAQISGDGFDASMERAVADLFHSFGGANPPVGRLSSRPARSRSAPDRRDARLDARQSDQGGRNPWAEPQYPAQEDPRSQPSRGRELSLNRRLEQSLPYLELTPFHRRCRFDAPRLLSHYGLAS